MPDHFERRGNTMVRTDKNGIEHVSPLVPRMTRQERLERDLRQLQHDVAQLRKQKQKNR